MAVPTISGVAPSPIWTGGQLITITGTNFRVPTIPSYPLAGPYPAPNATVRVTVGGNVAETVRVKSATQIECLASRHDAGPADVTVQNLDDTGAPIAGETITSSAAVTYARPKLTDAPDFDRLNRQVIRELKRQVIPNVVQFVSVDFGEAPFDVTALGDLPSLVISHPDMIEDRPHYNSNQNIYAGGAPSTTFQKRRVPRTDMLTYNILGFAESAQQIIPLQVLVRQFFDRNPKLTIARDPNDSSKGEISYTMYMPIETPVRGTTVANANDIKSFSGSFVIRGVNIEELASFPGEGIVETGGTAETLVTRPTRF
jgi:hypothetical protein